MKTLTRILAAGLFFLLCAAAPALAGASSRLRVGVLAWRGAERARAEWTPVIRALDKALPGHDFVLVPLTLSGMERAVRAGEVDFFITNPGNYAYLERQYGADRLATLETARSGAPGRAVGAVIFTSAAREDIHGLADLRGKTLLAVSKGAFGGFEIAWGVLRHAGIDPFSDLKQVKFVGFPLDKIVYAVRGGLADAGTVRACLLERMAAEGRIRMADFRILAPRRADGFDCALSSPLYPNWAFAKTRGTSHALAKKLAIALLAMDGPGVRHWTIPLSYQPVLDLFRYLRIGPYRTSSGALLAEFMQRNWGWFAFAGVLLVLGMMHVARTEYLVRLRTRELKESQQKARLRLAELAHVSRQVTLGELANGLAHEVNQPLGAIANYAAGCVRAMNRGAEPRTIEEPLREISRQAEHAGRILKNIRNYVRNRFEAREPVDVNDVLADAISLLGAEIRDSRTRVETDFASGLPRIHADRVGLEQVAVNLIRNALEAMRESTAGARRLKIATRLAGGRIEVSVSDSGPGLSEEARKQLFAPFHTSKKKGLGLGLSISRSIIHNHGGMIMARSGELGGLTIVFTLQTGAEQRS